MQKRSARAITLIELLLVIAIIGMIGGTLGIKSVRAIRYQRFEMQVETIRSQLQLAMELALIHKAPVTLTFGKTLNIDAPTMIPPTPLKGIEARFLGEENPTLFFPRCEGRLYLSRDDQHTTLLLHGYVRRIDEA